MTSDIAQPIYRVLDWTKCVIGGSYALQQYTGDKTWTPNDIDVPCDIATHEAFTKEVNRLLDAIPGATTTKLTLWSPAKRAEASRGKTGPDEHFHESIVATASLHVPGVPLPVQLVAVNTKSGPWATAGLVEHLSHITDAPACVSYTAGGERIFHVPPERVRAIETRRIPAFEICAARMDKYKARGYTFYE